MLFFTAVWKKIRDGEADIVIGARSAIFTPLKNIGVIIMDEEHSDTYKSDMSPRYHARETAIFRATQSGAAVVLASATPSVESYYKAQTGEYKLLEMNSRYNKNKLICAASWKRAIKVCFRVNCITKSKKI